MTKRRLCNVPEANYVQAHHRNESLENLRVKVKGNLYEAHHVGCQEQHDSDGKLCAQEKQGDIGGVEYPFVPTWANCQNAPRDEHRYQRTP